MEPLGIGTLQECDLVMKGGVTSGVVYPLAAVELAKKYRFRSIGGASAGAIAAALTTAAELGRQRGHVDRFAKLEEVALGLGRGLRGLFQPNPELATLFRVLFAAVTRKGAGKVRGALWAAATGYWVRTLLALLLALAVAVPAASAGRYAIGALALVLLLIVWPLLWLDRLRRDLTRTLPRRGFGLCPGSTQRGQRSPALVDWLTALLDEVAAQPRGEGTGADKPLTFGDLLHHDVELRAMTTCLTLKRPFSLPLDNRLFHFRREELARLFPARVVDWMTRDDVQGRTVEGSRDEASAAAYRKDGYYRVPVAADLPVVVAVRMSLSFPLLFEAVPLHARDFTRRDETEPRPLHPVWFSDGGLCRNFPIHLFDGLWPTRPTFGITLERYQQAVHGDERVFLPEGAGQGILRTFDPIDSLPGFVGALIDTMQEWQDTLQSSLAGYRERVVQVALDEDEGGLNLDMDPTVIARLVGYGRRVGAVLSERFDFAAHRWTRVVGAILRLDETLAAARPEDAAFVAERADVKPYGQSKKWKLAAADLLRAWQATVASESAATVRKTADFPRPVPLLRTVARE